LAKSKSPKPLAKPQILTQTPAVPTFVVDLPNVLYANRVGRKAKLINFLRLKEALANQFPGAQTIFVAEAKTRYIVDDKKQYDACVKNGEIIQIPPTEKADYYVLEYAKKKANCLVISCDQFKDYQIPDDLRRRVIPFVIMGEDVILSPKLRDCISD
jgi:hypothetical protein